MAAGIEPAYARVKVLCLTTWLHHNFCIEEQDFHPFERGWIHVRTTYQRSATIFNIDLYLPTKHSIILLRFFMRHAFKEFSFCSVSTGLEPEPSDHTAISVLPSYTRCLTPATPYRTLYIHPLTWFVHVAHLTWIFTHYSILTLTALRFQSLFLYYPLCSHGWRAYRLRCCLNN